MTARRFELPGIQDLTKEQERIRALPKKGQYLIVGGPGTGKSIMSLIRTWQLARDNEDYVFLVYNHLLHRANRQLFGEHLISDTWMSWYLKLFQRVASRSAPKLPRNNNGFRPIDWEATKSIVNHISAANTPALPFLVIDEGQDMPPAFYHTLINLGFEDFFVCCDQNQQIGSENSSRQDIQDSLGLDADEVIELTHNHRNAYPVARLAREFYPGDPASPRPALPDKPSVTTPTLYSYNGRDDGLGTVAARILARIRRQPDRLIGVIAPNNKVRERYYNALHDQIARIVPGEDRPHVETFHTDQHSDVRFDQGGVVVINAQACKGLEFDDVVLADIDQHNVRHRYLNQTQKLFYVMVSRARDGVFMFMGRSAPQAIQDILPTDPTILKRRST